MLVLVFVYCVHCFLCTLCYNIFKKRNGVDSMLKYKINVLSELKSRGFTSYRIRKEKIFGEAILQKFRNGKIIAADNLDTLCRLLECQPGDILEYVPDDEEQ